MHEAGMTGVQIAAHFKVKPKAVQQAIRKMEGAAQTGAGPITMDLKL
jgi:hypothetical protein